MKVYIYAVAAAAMVALPVVVWWSSPETQPKQVEAPLSLQIEEEVLEEGTGSPKAVMSSEPVLPLSVEDDVPFSYEEEPGSLSFEEEKVEPLIEEVEAKSEAPAPLNMEEEMTPVEDDKVVLAPVAPPAPPALSFEQSLGVEEFVSEDALSLPVEEETSSPEDVLSEDILNEDVLPGNGPDDSLAELDIPETVSPPVLTDSAESDFTEIEKEAFVFVLPQILSLTNMYAGLISSAGQSGNEEAARRLQSEFTSEVLAVIDDSQFLDREMYAQMSQRMLSDAEFEEEISARLRAFGVE